MSLRNICIFVTDAINDAIDNILNRFVCIFNVRNEWDFEVPLAVENGIENAFDDVINDFCFGSSLESQCSGASDCKECSQCNFGKLLFHSILVD